MSTAAIFDPRALLDGVCLQPRWCDSKCSSYPECVIGRAPQLARAELACSFGRGNAKAETTAFPSRHGVSTTPVYSGGG
jgi:hypothetical protein